MPGGGLIVRVGPTRPANNDWFHIVLNFIGTNAGEGFRIYHGGELVANSTRLISNRFPRIQGSIVIGRAFSTQDERYSSIQVDHLLFFNQALTEEEIKMLSR